MTSWKKHTKDPFVAAVERRVAALQPRRSKDAAGRRRDYAQFDDAMTALLDVTREDVATEEHVVAVPGHPDARVRVYWPSTQRAEPVEHGGLPVFVYFYGGGFELSGLDRVTWDAQFRARAHDAGVIVVAGDYSLAPEVTFPTQPEQCWAIFEWAAEHAGRLGGDPERMAIGGASSGGNLAAATALMNRDRNGRPVRLQVLEVPVLDLTAGHVAFDGVEPRLPRPILRQLLRGIVRQYVGPDRDARRRAYASPLLAASLAGLPPAVIYTAELDPLRGDGEAYARALAAAGVPVTCMRVIGQNHGSAAFRGYVPAADHLHRDVVATLRTLHDPAVAYPAHPAHPEATGA